MTLRSKFVYFLTTFREEHLYYVLIDMIRSPEILKLITKSSIRRLEERRKIEEKK